MLNRIKDRVTHAENTMQILKWASYRSDPYLFFSKFEMNFGAHITIEQNWNIAYQVVYYSTPKVWLLSLLADCKTFPDFRLWGNISHWLLLHFQECFGTSKSPRKREQVLIRVGYLKWPLSVPLSYLEVMNWYKLYTYPSPKPKTVKW